MSPAQPEAHSETLSQKTKQKQCGFSCLKCNVAVRSLDIFISSSKLGNKFPGVGKLSFEFVIP
jgi:hypothetical protein